IVTGSRVRYPEAGAEAAAATAGYTRVHDVSGRACQIERGGRWSRRTPAETGSPTGPGRGTRAGMPDGQTLDMWRDVSGTGRQTGTTSTMIFDPLFIVQYLSQFLVLEPGDLINPGTPPGVGMGFDPQVWLQPGDVMELGIEGLGTQRQNVIAPR